jgi:hypothetical protein
MTRTNQNIHSLPCAFFTMEIRPKRKVANEDVSRRVMGQSLQEW